MKSKQIHPTSKRNEQINTEHVLVLKLLHPLLDIGYFGGFFPFHVNDKSTITHHKICYIFVFLASFAGSSDAIFQFYSLFHSIFVEQRGILDIITQTVWITSAILSIFINWKAFFHHQAINNFLESWRKLEPSVVHLISESNAKRCTQICYSVYSLLAALSMGFCLFHVIRVPAYPVYILHFVKHEGGDSGSSFPGWMIALNSAVQMVRVAWVWVGTAMLECFCTVIATFISLGLKGIVADLERFYKCGATSTSDVQIKETSSDDDQKRSQTRYEMKCEVPSNSENENSPKGYDWCTCPLLISIRHYQTFSELQTLVNDFVGFLLFVDFAQLIVLICTLTFLPIKYIDMFDVDYLMIYCVNCACMIFRLIVLIVCIGNVYPAAQSTNVEFGKVITTRYFPNQVLNPVLGHLSIYSASPICFSAWGFFAITKGTLLTSISLIITYLLVFLQVKTT